MQQPLLFTRLFTTKTYIKDNQFIEPTAYTKRSNHIIH